MSNDRQWFWTKFVGSMLGLFSIMSILVGAANMHFEAKRDIDQNSKDIKGVGERMEETHDEIAALKERDHLHELSLKENSIQYSYILKELESLNNKMEKFEVVD